jgi:hypothetical protein
MKALATALALVCLAALAADAHAGYPVVAGASRAVGTHSYARPTLVVGRSFAPSYGYGASYGYYQAPVIVQPDPIVVAAPAPVLAAPQPAYVQPAVQLVPAVQLAPSYYFAPGYGYGFGHGTRRGLSRTIILRR